MHLHYLLCVLLAVPLVMPTAAGPFAHFPKTPNTSIVSTLCGDIWSNLVPPGLTPNDLPGYTGWPRPLASVAPLIYVVADAKATVVELGRTVVFRLECISAARACSSGGTLFYVRFYGPAIQVPDKIVDHRNGSYGVVVTFYDAGRWFMEVIIEYSRAPAAIQRFPNAVGELPYEGYPAKGSPLVFKVIDSAQEDLPVQTWCRPSQLSGLRGRWHLIGRMQPTHEINSQMSLLGLSFRFQPYACGLLPLSLLLKKCASLVNPLHVVFVGDSTMKAQFDAFQLQKVSCSKKLDTWATHFIETHSGLRVRLREITNSPVDRKGARGQAESTHMTAPSTVAIPAPSAPRFPTFHICLE